MREAEKKETKFMDTVNWVARSGGKDKRQGDDTLLYLRAASWRHCRKN